MKIILLDNDLEKKWDDYVIGHPESTFYHMSGWRKTVHRTYGHEPVYLASTEDGRINGILPMFILKSLIFGNKLVSIPFGSYGGILSDNQEITEALVKKAKEITRENELDYLEFRNLKQNKSDLLPNDVYVTFMLDLDPDPEVVWKGKLNAKVRNATRKAEKSGVTFEINNKYLKDFYNLFSKSMNRVGTPVHDLGFFENLLQEYPDKTGVFAVKKDGKVIAALIALMHEDHIISGWEASDGAYLRYNPNNLLYWEAIKYGCEKGYRIFDFGRSINNSGTFKFKKPWGAEIIPLHYKYYLNKAEKIPDTSQANTKRQVFSNYWNKIPLEITKKIGPMLRKNLP